MMAETDPYDPLTTRNAEAVPAAEAEGSASPGEIMAHKLEDTYPKRPTPIKVQNGDNNDRSDVAIMDTDIDQTEGKEEEEGMTEDLIEVETSRLPPFPAFMDMLEPQGTSDEDGVIEIEFISDDGEGVEMGMSPLDNHKEIGITGDNGMVEEILITSDNEDMPFMGLPGTLSPPATPSESSEGGFELGLDKFAEQMEGLMKDLTDGFQIPPSATVPKNVSDGSANITSHGRNTSIDKIMYPNGTPTTSLPPPPTTPDAAIATALSNMTSAAPAPGGHAGGWNGTGKILAIVILSVVVPLMLVSLMGYCLYTCIRRMKAKRKGYDEVQSRLSNDEEWN